MRNNKLKILQLCISKNKTVDEFDLFEEVVRAFNPDKFDVTYGLLTGGADAELEARLQCDVVYFGLNKKQLKPRALGTYYRLWKFIRDNQFDVIITHRYKPSYFVALISLLVSARRYISVYHGLGQLDRFSRKLIAKAAFNDRWRIVGVSDAVINDLKGAGITSERLVKINNSVDVDKMRSLQLGRGAARKVLGVEAEDFVFATIGVTRKVKGHAYLIDGFAPIAKSNQHFKLLVIGGGPLEEELKQQARDLGIDQQVIITGLKPNAYQYLKAVDVFVMPSLYEGMPIALLEAMATELPILAASVGGIPEMLGPDSKLFSAKNSKAVEHAMRDLLALTEEERKVYGQRLHQRLRETYSIDRYHAAYVELVDDVF